ncbi:hypothetical protein ACWCV5_32770 [Streptomyces tubercidicus]
MSSTAAAAAVRVPGPRRPGRHLASVPASGRPSDGGLGDALRLGRGMRLRLLAAVRALLADPSVAGLKDAPRLAAVVLYAKSRAPRGEKNDLQTSTWGPELGRWLGVKESTIHHKVLPVLRSSGAARTRVVTDAKGHPTGLDCLVMPLWNAHHGGGAGHPLALSKAELAVLLRLCEALFGPGWEPKDKEPTPPGLLAGRTGRGAATDRLGLLLMVLNTRASGWLQLCGGSVKKREGRGAATLARLLGCSPSGARKILARLTEAGVVARQRRATATRMNGRGRVMLLPVARAYGRRTVASAEAVQGPGTVSSARPDGAFGDHGPAGADGSLGTSGICAAQDAEAAADQERPDGAELHADHASVVTEVGESEGACGFSGYGREGSGDLPGRARTREEQAVDPAPAAAPVAVTGGSVALRAERQTISPHPALSPLLPALCRQAPQVADILTSIIPSPNSHQRDRLSALVRGLLIEGEDDAMVAARLRDRLRPLATGDEGRPYAFRRDGLSWALAIGLPYTPGGKTTMPCARRGCRGTVRARPTDTVRCDDCELAVQERQQAVRARTVMQAAFTAPMPPPAVEPPVASAPAVPAPRPAQPHPEPAAASADGAPLLPESVREQLRVLTAIAPKAAQAAEKAARVAYTPAAEGDSPALHERRVSTATATWFAITGHYAEQLAAAYRTEELTGSAA